jgi:hypothetical protein
MGGFFCCYNRCAIRRDELMSDVLVYPSWRWGLTGLVVPGSWLGVSNV